MRKFTRLNVRFLNRSVKPVQQTSRKPKTDPVALMEHRSIQECIIRLECIIIRGRLPLEELGHLQDVVNILRGITKGAE